ncbi:GNAT family N-acetyltransferase [Glycomyces paridis]|uniref:GNAT family N-acetyltransferase n=1 Tax=Glycomyces paridis TaxID=2126555 RepID=A0A4V4HP12_9ACTN|nr:GNAT family N-acetyltransferase [Glycomyces paridis]
MGRFLLDDAEALLFAAHPAIRLETFAANTAARAFYEARGWRPGAPLEGEPARLAYVKHAD